MSKNNILGIITKVFDKYLPTNILLYNNGKKLVQDIISVNYFK